jgi:hypothetical protein
MASTLFEPAYKFTEIMLTGYSSVICCLGLVQRHSCSIFSCAGPNLDKIITFNVKITRSVLFSLVKIENADLEAVHIRPSVRHYGLPPCCNPTCLNNIRPNELLENVNKKTPPVYFS